MGDFLPVSEVLSPTAAVAGGGVRGRACMGSLESARESSGVDVLALSLGLPKVEAYLQILHNEGKERGRDKGTGRPERKEGRKEEGKKTRKRGKEGKILLAFEVLDTLECPEALNFFI